MSESKRRGAPYKAGLDYIPQTVDPMSDMRIYDLTDKYGPLGYMVYDLTLKYIMSQGYYVECSLPVFVRMIQSRIGNRWIRNRAVVEQVIHYMADIGLLDDDLLSVGVITSADAQRLYYETAVKRLRRRPNTEKYWLLDQPSGNVEGQEEASGLLNLPSGQINAEESRINAELNRINAELIHTEKKEKEKENNIDIGSAESLGNSEVDKALSAYIMMRRTRGRLSDIQIQELITVLTGITIDPAEQVQVIRQATVHGWSSFYPVTKPKAAERQAKTGSGRKTSSFYNFEQRKYDYDQLEAAMLNMPIETGEAAAEGDECKTG